MSMDSPQYFEYPQYIMWMLKHRRLVMDPWIVRDTSSGIILCDTPDIFGSSVCMMRVAHLHVHCCILYIPHLHTLDIQDKCRIVLGSTGLPSLLLN